MINFSFSQEVLLKHFTDYFDTSLKYFRSKYLHLFLNDGDLIPIHVAYLCPLCIKNFILVLYEEKKILATSDFNLDHYPQKSIGGGNTLLVCKSCNNQAGHNYEFALKKHLQLSSFGEKGLSHKVDVKTSIPNVGNFNSKIWKNEHDQWEISMKPNQNIKIKPLDEWLEFSKTNNDWTIEITIQNPKDNHIHKAMIKSAYLYCFAQWGYEFAFSKTGDLFRSVLSDQSTYPMTIMQLKFDKATLPNYDAMPTGVCYISKPEELKSFVVNIRVRDKIKNTEAIYPIFIPNPSETGIGKLKQIQDFMNTIVTTEMTFVNLNNILNITPIAYSQSWHDVQHL